jgi:hypothetical protein
MNVFSSGDDTLRCKCIQVLATMVVEFSSLFDDFNHLFVY